MSSNILELIRSKHEAAEVHERLIVDVLDDKPNGQKAKVKQQHCVKKLVDTITNTNKELVSLYDDHDHLFRDEIAHMRGNQMFKSFYESLNHIREYHIKYPNLDISSIPTISDDVIEKNMHFSGEEVYGKYLDLHQSYHHYINIQHIISPSGSSSASNMMESYDYISYLDQFYTFFHIASSSKLSHHKAYTSYLEEMWVYLSSFFHRIQPLVDVDHHILEWQHSFEDDYSTGKIAGWTSSASSTSSSASSTSSTMRVPQPLRLGMFNTSEELEALGMDRLKEACEAMGLKCGGTLKDRATRLWMVRGKKIEDIPDKLKASSSSSKRKYDDMQQPSSSSSAGDVKKKMIAWYEYRIMMICNMMMDVIIATRRHVSKQQTRTSEEKEMELYEAEHGLMHDHDNMPHDDDDDEPIYNPLNLPLGWDGKPIPYWLYKLHDLGREYKCEICGNHSYYGRRNFDKHFQEWKHGYGMRCLGIPNTKHFHDIVVIDDAVALYSKIRDQLKAEQFVADMQEEYEDSQGNVLNRRTYEDLARQGLL